jgi:uncharacterized protein
MRAFLIIVFSCLFSGSLLGQSAVAQAADNDPATRDDVILLFRTMHSHDMLQKMIEVQSKTMQQLLHDQLATKEKDIPADFDARWKKMMDELYKDMPLDQMTQAMIPAYQKHFTHGDIAAMNAFYSSPVGQKVLDELPVVTQEGMQEMMPILMKYMEQWKARMQKELENSPRPKENTSLQD